MKTVTKGDPYVPEVAATVSAVMQQLYKDSDMAKRARNSYILAWQSQVGYLPWMGPQTSDVIEGLGRQGHKHVLIVPIAFTSDHIETLFELDMENAELAHKSGVSRYVRAPSLNDEPLLADAMAYLVKTCL
jgi:protoporphyrin/coproporphyrin ferrochelatase